MPDAIIWKFLADNWPQLTGTLAAMTVGYRLMLFAGTQHLTNRRVRKLMKLHSQKHESDGAYLYDDSVE